MYDYFKWCEKANIDVDDAYIAGVAASIKKAFPVKNDMDSIALVAKARKSYEEWWRQNKPNPDGTLLGIRWSEISKAKFQYLLVVGTFNRRTCSDAGIDSIS